MRYSFTINEKLPSLNEVINKNRYNRYAGAKLKKDIDNLICIYIRRAIAIGTIAPLGEQSCTIHIDYYERTKRRDVDNIQSAQKFILDALQHTGILKNDSRRYVKQITSTVYDSDADAVVVMLFSEEPGGEVNGSV